MTDNNFLEKNLLAHPDLPDSGVLTPARVAAAAAAWSISFPAGSSDEDQKEWINEIAVQLEPGLWGRIKTEASVTKHFITKWATRGSSVTLPKEITVTIPPPLRPSAAAAGGSKTETSKNVQCYAQSSSTGVGIWDHYSSTTDSGRRTSVS